MDPRVRARSGSITSTRGHVFLEVFVDRRWKLFDAVQGRLYDDYDPRARILPGDRLAYDKGGDPSVLPLSSAGRPWLDQTFAFFRDYDVSTLPVTGGRLALVTDTCFAATDCPACEWLAQRCGALGLPVRSTFNGDFERQLSDAAGHWLILTAVGPRVVLPAAYEAAYSPASRVEIEQLLAAAPSGRRDRRLADGTRVTLLFARDPAGLRREIEKLDGPPP